MSSLTHFGFSTIRNSATVAINFHQYRLTVMLPSPVSSLLVEASQGWVNLLEINLFYRFITLKTIFYTSLNIIFKKNIPIHTFIS